MRSVLTSNCGHPQQHRAKPVRRSCSGSLRRELPFLQAYDSVRLCTRRLRPAPAHQCTGRSGPRRRRGRTPRLQRPDAGHARRDRGAGLGWLRGLPGRGPAPPIPLARRAISLPVARPVHRPTRLPAGGREPEVHDTPLHPGFRLESSIAQFQTLRSGLVLLHAMSEPHSVA